eukprot:TRINITY_DN32397_c0_g2_i1.p1 TRINITY_DN32397_c0_g2~~TRINITY_DN32397_c0_g2_i1.p1  ORF type:complete len:525 (+),score=101.27 TRINITY_DN32397_c0_g2_i1:95-1669(+)
MDQHALSSQQQLRCVSSPVRLLLCLLAALVSPHDCLDASTGANVALRGSAHNDAPLDGADYIIVIDAGSSGSRIHVIDVLQRAEGGAAVPKLNLTSYSTQTMKVKPGLSFHAGRGDYFGLERSLQQLLEFADSLIPPSKRPSTPVLLAATAGLRRLGGDLAQGAMQRARQTLGSHGYLFCPSWAKILEGREEAGFAWVAANYISGELQQAAAARSAEDAAVSSSFKQGGSSGESSRGVVELGGGSMQVAFEVPKNADISLEDSFSFTDALGQEYLIYAHSYLGFGVNYAQRTYEEEFPPNRLDDPCYPLGQSRRARAAENSSTIGGSGNFEDCKRLIRDGILSGDARGPGRYAGELVPRGNFTGAGSLLYARLRLQQQPLQPLLGDERALAAASEASCRGQDGQSQKDCFSLAYQAAVLEALGVHANPEARLQLSDPSRESTPDWAIGAALAHLLKAPSCSGGGVAALDMHRSLAEVLEPPRLAFSSVAFCCSGPLLAVVLVKIVQRAAGELKKNRQDTSALMV